MLHPYASSKFVPLQVIDQYRKKPIPPPIENTMNIQIKKAFDVKNTNHGCQ